MEDTIVFESPSDAVVLKSNLDLINDCDNFPYQQTDPSRYAAHTETCYHLVLPSHVPTYGLLLPSIAEIFRSLPDFELDDTLRTLTLCSGTTRAERSAIMARTTQAMRATGHFKVLEGWRDELYPVFGETGEILFEIERAASALFGVVTYGCHMTAYTESQADELDREDAMRIWIPRRSLTKQTYGGALDNTVAGGISIGERPFESLVREAAEEASLAEDLVRSKARPVGTVTYFHIRDEKAGGEKGLLQPECQFVYDLLLPEEVIPAPGDEEVENFNLLSVREVKEAMANGEFKPNCALVLMNFFIRHGLLHTENERDYIELVSRLHRLLPFPMAKH